MIKDIFDGDEILNPEEEKIDSIIDENGEEIIFEPFNIPDAGEIEDIEKKKREKVYINGVDVTILNERVQIRNSEGKLITTSYKEYSKQKVHEEFSSLDDFLNRWSSSEKKQVIIDELYEKDILFNSHYNKYVCNLCTRYSTEAIKIFCRRRQFIFRRKLHKRRRVLSFPSKRFYAWLALGGAS